MHIKVEGLKNDTGVLRWCASNNAKSFPECGADQPSGTVSITHGRAQFELPISTTGNVAIATFHDVNKNAKLDTFLGIPREGYGFSKNPPFMPRAPKFNESAIDTDVVKSITIKMRYIL